MVIAGVMFHKVATVDVNVSNVGSVVPRAHFSRLHALHHVPAFHNTMRITKITAKFLKQELTQRGLPTDGLKPALVERLQLTMPANS